MILVSRSSGSYELVLMLHILAAIVGFGAVFLNGLYGAAAKQRQGPEGLAIAETTFKVSTVAEYFIYAVLLLGIGLVFMSDDVIEFEQMWVGVSIFLYLVAIGVVHAVHRPNLKAMNRLMGELVAMGPPPAGAPAAGPPPQVAELERRGNMAAAVGGGLNIVMVVILVLMVFKPDGPPI